MGLWWVRVLMPPARTACLALTPLSLSGWGTHAAAVVAAQPEVAAGTAGLAPGTRIMPLKIASCR